MDSYHVKSKCVRLTQSRCVEMTDVDDELLHYLQCTLALKEAMKHSPVPNELKRNNEEPFRFAVEETENDDLGFMFSDNNLVEAEADAEDESLLVVKVEAYIAASNEMGCSVKMMIADNIDQCETRIMLVLNTLAEEGKVYTMDSMWFTL